MFKAPFSFDGRIRRLEYGVGTIISTVAYYGVIFLGALIHPIIFVLYLPILWFAIAQGAKRCHDRGNSGWYQLIPLYGLWMLFADGDLGPNEYGDNPKGIGNEIPETAYKSVEGR
ncbi:MAG: DUF805 domain-containing protein [Bacteroidota bacterium]